MLICTEGIEGKKLSVRILLTNKRVTFKKGGESDVSLTPDEEKALLEMKLPKGWKLKKKPKETKEKEVKE
jgi:hypothetical protein